MWSHCFVLSFLPSFPPIFPFPHMPVRRPVLQSYKCTWEVGAEPLSPLWNDTPVIMGKLYTLVTSLPPLVVCVYIILCPSYVKYSVLDFFGVNKCLVLFIKKNTKDTGTHMMGLLLAKDGTIRALKEKSNLLKYN